MVWLPGVWNCIVLLHFRCGARMLLWFPILVVGWCRLRVLVMCRSVQRNSIPMGQGVVVALWNIEAAFGWWVGKVWVEFVPFSVKKVCVMGPHLPNGSMEKVSSTIFFWRSSCRKRLPRPTNTAWGVAQICLFTSSNIHENGRQKVMVTNLDKIGDFDKNGRTF